MRILIDYRPALRQRTGVGHYAHESAAALARDPRDHVTVFSSSWKDRIGSDIPAGTTPLDARMPVRVLNLAWHRLQWPPIEWFGASADIAHSMHPLLMPSRTAAQVVTIHDLHFLDRPDRARAEIRRDYPALARSHAHRADAVVVVSEYTRDLVEKRLGVPAERIAVCPPGAPPWRPRSADAPDGPILFVGTLEPRKNLERLVRAYRSLLARVPGAPPLVMAGGTADGMEPLLEHMGEGSLAGRVRHLGYVADDARERLYREASMLVLPSFDEGFGLPLLEAMTVGLPAIVARRGALPEVAREAAVFVEPEDEGAIMSAMERLLKERPHAMALAVAGIERARAFSWAGTAARLRAAYAMAIARRREKSPR